MDAPTRGSVIWFSCRVSMLQSQYYPPPNSFMADLLRQAELKQLRKEEAKKQTGDESQPR